MPPTARAFSRLIVFRDDRPVPAHSSYFLPHNWNLVSQGGMSALSYIEVTDQTKRALLLKQEKAPKQQLPELGFPAQVSREEFLRFFVQVWFTYLEPNLRRQQSTGYYYI